MKQEELSRRSVLALLGVSAAGITAAGTGTAALLSDRETLPFFFETGTVDLRVGWEGSVTKSGETRAIGAAPDADGDGAFDGPPFGHPCVELPNPDDMPHPLFSVESIEPGDSGEATFALHLCGNDGYVWMTGLEVANIENVFLPSEQDAGDDTAEVGELGDRLQARVWYDENCDGVYDDGEITILSGSLASVLDRLESGIRLSPNPASNTCSAMTRVSDPDEAGKIDESELAVGERFEFTMGGETIVLEVTDLAFKDDNGAREVIGAELTVISPEEAGLCRVDVFAAGQSKSYHFPGCESSVWVDSIEQTAGTGGGYYMISHLTPFGCRRDPECFVASNTHCIGFEWWLPDDAPLDAQNDSIVFDLGFEAVQCRHNPTAQRP
jgi:hypothetical protein